MKVIKKFKIIKIILFFFVIIGVTYSCNKKDTPTDKTEQTNKDTNNNKDDNKPHTDIDSTNIDRNTILVTHNATSYTIGLFKYLQLHYKKDIISCAMSNVDWNLNECNWVYSHTGKYPAMAGLDFISIYNQSKKYDNISDLISWHKKGGLITLMWHWNVPRTEGSTSNYGFYSVSNHDQTGNSQYSSISPKALDDTTSWIYKYLVKDIKQVADIMINLQNSDIPIIWRPLHEASGGWFWWGQGGAASYKKLWKLMFDIFQDKGVKNTIWVWTSQGNDDEWYPGDHYVDIIGRDFYNNANNISIAAEFTNLQKKYPNKLITLSECGNISTIPEQWEVNANWSWFMPWYDYNRTKDTTNAKDTSHKWANIIWWKAAFNMNNCITRDEVDLTILK